MHHPSHTHTYVCTPHNHTLLMHHPLSSVGPLATGKSQIFLAKGLSSLLVKWGGPLVDKPRVWRWGCGRGQSVRTLKRQPPQSEGQGEQPWALFSVHHCLIMGREEGGRLEGGWGPGAVRYNGRLLSSTTNLQLLFLRRDFASATLFFTLAWSEDTGMCTLSFKKK